LNIFGQPDARIPFVIEPAKHGDMWALHGKSYPHTHDIILRSGGPNRLIFDNRSQMDHAVHLHRHTFELVSHAGEPSSGVLKDVLIVPPHNTCRSGRDSAESRAFPLSPPSAIPHGFGFMAVMRYSQPLVGAARLSTPANANPI
jgi:FtsP/CotA-like multicopper oxidase with cupredoxin domain